MAEVDPSTSIRHFLEPLAPFLNDPSVTEIVINRPQQVYVEARGRWVATEVPELTYAYLLQLGVANAHYAGENLAFSSTSPILSCVLPDGERAQYVMPPACKAGTVSLTIRKPSFQVREIDEYISGGFFDKIKPPREFSEADEELLELQKHLFDADDVAQKRAHFLERCVELGKNIVIAGGTGSGKTTFMKALMQRIPTDERIITIEDVPELVYGLPKHDNIVNLFYPSEQTAKSTVTAAGLLRSCLRMKPDRILLAELRGGETFDFLNVCMSGHGGSITSCHAGSCQGVFDYLALKVLQSPVGSTLPYPVIQRLLNLVIDVVVHIANDREIGRHITEIWCQLPRPEGRGL